MDRRFTMRALASLTALAVLGALAAAVAVANPGDTPDEPIVLQVPTSAAGVTTSGHEWVIYSVPAIAGQTIRIEASSSVSACQMRMGAFSITSRYLQASSVGTGAAVLTFLPPATGDYLLAFTSDELGAFSLTATPSAPPAYGVGSMWAPRKIGRGHSISVAARTFPGYNGLKPPVKFYIEKWTGKRWKLYGTAPSHFDSISLGGSSTKLTASFKISKRGSYRVRARFSDAAHPVARTSKWASITVR